MGKYKPGKLQSVATSGLLVALGWQLPVHAASSPEFVHLQCSQSTASKGCYKESVSLRANWFGMVRQKLKDLRDYLPDWDGYGAPAPNATSLANADEILQALAIQNAPIVEVMACADGGVALFCCESPRSVLVECFNDGEVTVGRSAGPGSTEANSVDSPNGSFDNLADDIIEYLNG
jgi:hypothetical protein